LNTQDFVKNVPPEMRNQKNWVAWILKQKKDNPSKMDKVPVNAVTKGLAQSNNPETWCKFSIAVEYAEKHNLNGIGFMLSPPFVGIDIDHCIDENGELSPMASEILSSLPTYAEISPSGTGLHIFCKGTLPPKGRKNSSLGLEIYNEGRFLTFTGRLLGGHESVVADCNEQIQKIHAKYLAKPEPLKVDRVITSEALSESEVLRKAMDSKGGSKFSDLYNGNWQSYFSSQSEADLAFCNSLAFWTGADGQAMDSLFKQSGLYRDKWDDRHFSNGTTYGASVIEKALAGCKEVYKPPKEVVKVKAQESSAVEILAGPNKRADQFYRQSYHRTGILGYKVGKEFDELMHKLDGIQKGMYLLGAISNVGKTSWLLNLCKSLVENNKGLQVVFFSIDDNFRKIYFRLMAMETKHEINYVSNIGQNVTYNKDLSDADKKEKLSVMEKGKVKIDELLNRFTLLDETNGNTLEYIEQTIEKLFDENPELVVVVDNFHKIRTPTVSGSDPRSRFTFLSEEMKRITNKFDIPLLMTVELRKPNGNKPPTADDLKDTVDLHYDSDIVFLLHSDSERDKDSTKFMDANIGGNVYRSPIVDLIVAKNKLSGFKGTIEYVLTPSLAIYQEESCIRKTRVQNALASTSYGKEVVDSGCPW